MIYKQKETFGILRRKLECPDVSDPLTEQKDHLKIMSYIFTAIKSGIIGFDAIHCTVLGESVSIFARRF